MSDSSPEPGPINSRRRLTASERRRQIAERGGELVARYGSYGVSMQAVADAVGLTVPGLMHHVRDRDELLTLIIESYDGEDAVGAIGPSDFEAAGGASLPLVLWSIIAQNARRPELVALFARLAVEAGHVDHPAHSYFAHRHHVMLTGLAGRNWRLPARFDSSEAVMDLLRTAFSAMDGAQIQSLTDPDEDLVSLWSRVDRVLFGADEWDGYRE